MASTLRISGQIDNNPVAGISSGIPSMTIPVDESVALSDVMTSQYDLTVNTPVVVAFGTLTAASVVVVKTLGGKVTVRFTSADGSVQAIPVDSFMQLISRSVPFTAIDLTRVAGQSTQVSITLGQAA